MPGCSLLPMTLRIDACRHYLQRRPKRSLYGAYLATAQELPTLTTNVADSRSLPYSPTAMSLETSTGMGTV